MLIGITMGDANGIGPELMLKAYQDREIQKDFILIGDYEILNFCNELLNYRVPLIKTPDTGSMKEGFLNIYDMGIMDRNDLKIGQISEKAGYAARKYVEQAVTFALEKRIDAMVTLPICKEAIRIRDKKFSGHTELIAGMCSQTNYAMMLTSEKLTAIHVSTHIPLKKAAEFVRKDRVYNVIKLAHEALSRTVDNPRIAVAGLNPHSGESGAFGREEIEEIAPAVLKARREGIDAEGPIPPDTVILKAYNKKYDVVVCMYHDQGHIPIKLLDFEGAVNVTLGLKVIRTSVAHGTAFDIAYKGTASTRSFVEAFKFAARMIV